MSYETNSNWLGKYVDKCKTLFSTMGEEEVSAGTETLPMGDDEHTNPNGNDDDYHSIEAGKRSERWFERIDDQVENNRKQSIENSNYLARLDYRTVWIIRLLVGLVCTVLGGIILQVLPL